MKEFSSAQVRVLQAAREGQLQRQLGSYAVVEPTEGDYGPRYIRVRRPTVEALVRSGHLYADLTLTPFGREVVG